MADISDIAQAAALLGDPARANMLCALKDDGALSASELAHIAGVAPNTASGHLARLREAGLISMQPSGRIRYYRLANHEVADFLETLEAFAGQIAPAERASTRGGLEMRFARSCYDHLAGTLAVRLTDAFVSQGYIERTSTGFTLQDEGRSALLALGIDLDRLCATRRPMLRPCPDWSESRDHMGGTLPARLFEFFLRHGWLRRKRGVRAIELTPKGEQALRAYFDLKF
jgi:DNA-binding transcriptional ArsR family regulator